jgi:ABC-2 type transport system permease protein
MTTATATADTAAPMHLPTGAMGFVRDTILLTGRSLRAIPRVPERLLDVTIQPIIFILLFLYVFGSAIHVPGVNYKDFMFPGIIGQSLAFGVIGAGVATSNDMTEGVVDRFRSMPISRLSIISGQVMGQFCEQVLGMVIVVVFGLALGWDPQLTFVHGLELAGLMVLGMFAFTWAGVLFGTLVRSPDAMQGVGFIVIFPLSFLAGTSCRSPGWTPSRGPSPNGTRSRRWWRACAASLRPRSISAAHGSSTTPRWRWPSGA